MLSLKLNSTKGEEWDIVFEEGQLLTISDAEYIPQKVKQILLTNRGEFFRGVDYGVPWTDEILGTKKPDEALIKNLIIDTLINNETLISLGVSEVDVSDFSLDVATRTLTMKLKISHGDETITTEIVV